MSKISYAGYRFPSEIIQQAIWLYVRFTLSFRDVEDLLAERGIMVSYETVRRWVNHFGPKIAADLRKRRLKPHTTWHLDEVYLKIDGRMVYLWRAVDAEGEVLDVLVQTRRNKRAALKRHCHVVTDPSGQEIAGEPPRRRHAMKPPPFAAQLEDGHLREPRERLCDIDRPFFHVTDSAAFRCGSGERPRWASRM
jgi:hypothetical protein